MKKRMIALALSATMVLSAGVMLAGCSGDPDPNPDPNEKENVSLVLWGPSQQQTMAEEMIEAFKAKYTDKNYSITYNVVSEADAAGTITTDVSAGADVYAFANDQLLVLQRAGALAQVGGSYLEDIRANNSASSVEAATFDGKVYAYPYSDDNGYFLYYDKSKVDSPETLAGILEDCAASGSKFIFDLDNSWYDAAFFFGAGASYEVTYNSDGSVNTVACDFDDATKGTVAGKAMIELANSSAFLNGDDNSITAELTGGTFGAAVSGTWNAKVISETLGENYAACKLPTFEVDGQTYQMGSFAGCKLYGVNPTSDHLADAHRLAAFLSGEEMQQKRYDDMQIGPSNTKVAASDAVKANIALAALADQAQYATAQIAVPGGFWTAVEAFGQEVVAKTVTTENLAEKLKTMADLIRASEN
ncbi:MAG TPA: extracellular solute-binding protein [Candidatus Gallimonas intestinavium]|uniref:Extracellular solute-binding protein n=1 Tax=Candidatus Gallimonas intestinavium TaxID=2838603 RepID=A0A9D2G3I3_9FIRM|nr:extracellular solute-binding protein [Candidatus Gallimonas intestinavium]